MNHKLLIVASVLSVFVFCSTGFAQKAPVKKFKEPENTAVFTTRFVTADKKDITRITHDEDDGAWQFFSDDKIEDFSTVAKLVSLGQIIQLDSTVLEVADMPVGYSAHRKAKGDKWIIEKVIN